MERIALTRDCGLRRPEFPKHVSNMVIPSVPYMVQLLPQRRSVRLQLLTQLSNRARAASPWIHDSEAESCSRNSNRGACAHPDTETTNDPSKTVFSAFIA